MRQLASNELNSVSGGLVEVYPTALYGYEIIGWTEDVIGYDTTSWSERKDFFTTIEHIQVTPIYDIQPIYAPVMTTVYYY